MTQNTYATFFLVLSLLFASSLVHSAQVWDLYNFKVQPGKATAVLKAFNDLQMSEAGSNRMASVHLQQSVFGGSSGTTHSIVALYPSRAEFERARMALAGTKAWKKFQAAMSANSEAINNSAMETLMGWGTVSNKDTVWEAIRVNVSDPGAVVTAFNALMTSKSAEAFPGEVWLSAISYGNAADGDVATHVITVGYESMAEMEAWNDQIRKTQAWADFGSALQGNMRTVNRELVQFLSVFDHQMSLENFTQ